MDVGNAVLLRILPNNCVCKTGAYTAGLAAAAPPFGNAASSSANVLHRLRSSIHTQRPRSSWWAIVYVALCVAMRSIAPTDFGSYAAAALW